jgi:hypothetical protein
VLSNPDAGLAGHDAGDSEFIGLALPIGSEA